MEYAFLRFNDELKVNLNGLGLVPAISFYPELWALYLERMPIQAEYLIEVIKGLKNQENNAEELDKQIKAINGRINKKVRELGILPVRAVVKTGEDKGDTIVRDLLTRETFYVNSLTFKSNITNEFEAKTNSRRGQKNENN